MSSVGAGEPVRAVGCRWHSGGDAHAAPRHPAVRHRRGALAGARPGRVSFPVAQVLVRRGLADAGGRARLAGRGRRARPRRSSAGHRRGGRRSLRQHASAGSRITVHGDYDVDGVASTAILVRALRALGADVDWYLPGRSRGRLRPRRPRPSSGSPRAGTRLLITADCAITAVDEVARRASLGHRRRRHRPPHAARRRRAARRADRPSRASAATRAPTCARPASRYKLAGALLAAAGHDAAIATADLDLVALATVADCVPLRGENRRLVRAGLRALAPHRRSPGCAR